MTREEAIIEAGIEYSIQNSPYCIGGDNFYEKARELNRNKSFEAGVIWADKNPKSPWISVKEDLPCNHEELIIDDGLLDKHTKPGICNKSYGVSCVGIMIYNVDKKAWHWVSEKPTHWFPIPELPKEKE